LNKMYLSLKVIVLLKIFNLSYPDIYMYVIVAEPGFWSRGS
jgi:hypothetical protein